MKFILVEDVNDLTSGEFAETYNKYKKKWDSAKTPEKQNMVIDILEHLSSNNKCSVLLESFTRSCYKLGIDPTYNPFMIYIPALCNKITPTSRYNEGISILVELYSSGVLTTPRLTEMNKASQYLYNPSLFNRDSKDFTYTVNVFETVLVPDRAKKYFKDTSEINVDKLYVNERGTGEIKPAGSQATADDTKTIYGTVEAWSEGGENDADDISNVKKKYTKSQLSDIKKRKTYAYEADIPEEERKTGNVVFLQFKGKHSSDPVDFDNYVNSFVQYDGSEWKVVDM